MLKFLAECRFGPSQIYSMALPTLTQVRCHVRDGSLSEVFIWGILLNIAS